MAIETHWHQYNPWAAQVIYVPEEELAEAISGGEIQHYDGTVEPYNAEYILMTWRRFPKRDCYILPHPTDKYHSVGVRYGKEGHEYLSPYGKNWDALAQLIIKYQRKYPN